MKSLRFSVVLLCICLLAGVQGAPECYVPKDTGPCRGHFERYYFNSRISKCLPFGYGGCGGNRNNFETLKDCRKTCMSRCDEPKVVGFCRARIPRFYFNNQISQCEPFYYGGCGGNFNNFKTSEDCEKTCVTQCRMPKKVGRCRGYFRRYYFNAKDFRCERFIYGGCGGNLNNFETIRDCEAACLG